MIFTIFGVLGILVTSLLPETKGVPLAETVEDTDRMVEQFKYFEWRTWQDPKPKRVKSP